MLRLLLAAGLVALSGPAMAQQPMCAPRAKVLEALATQYSETPRAFGLNDAGSMVELAVSESGSFTLLVTRPDGITCIITGGEGWQDRLPPVDKGKPA